MASSTVLSSPRPLDVEVDLSPAASLSELDTLCSGPLDSFLEEATRVAKRRTSAAAGAQQLLSGSTTSGARRSKAAPKAGAVKLRGAGGVGGGRALTAASSGAGKPPTVPLDPVRLAKLRAANEIVHNSWQYKATGSVKAAAVLAGVRARRLASGGPNGLAAQAAALIDAQALDDTTYLYDLGNTTRLYKAWCGALPRVQPFYAVKCNPEPVLLRLLAALGAGFDCASKAELEAVLALGVPRDRIIFAHPCKRACDLRYARDVGVQMTTFDTESELAKVAAVYPGIQLVLRVRCDDPEARCPLGLKYGCDPAEATRLLQVAADLGLSVVGVSFHVGSGCKNLSAYDAAIATARAVFDAGEALGHRMSLLDVGGGFSGRFDDHGHVMFGDIARTINAALSAHFPATGPGACPSVRVISEPGRFFAETSAALLVPVYGQRDRPLPGGGLHKDYWCTDGLYGSFNCILYDDQKPQPLVLRSPRLPPVCDDHPSVLHTASADAAAASGPPVASFESTLWGPTCDSADFIYKDVALPELRNGDWLMFVNAGAYTVAGACNFNGIAMTSPHKFYVFSACAVDEAGEGEPDDDEATTSSEEGESGEESGDEGPDSEASDDEEEEGGHGGAAAGVDEAAVRGGEQGEPGGGGVA